MCVPKSYSMYHLTWSPVRANKGHVLTPSNHSSRFLFDTLTDMLDNALEDAPQSYATAKKHVSITLSIHKFPLTPTYQALFRDGYRCVVTGKYDINSLLKIKELKENFAAHGHHSSGMDATQCTHTFAESTNQNIEPGSQKVCRYLSA